MANEYGVPITDSLIVKFVDKPIDKNKEEQIENIEKKEEMFKLTKSQDSWKHFLSEKFSNIFD